MRETTALGAALAAGLSTGVFQDVTDFQPTSGTEIFEPRMSNEGIFYFILSFIVNRPLDAAGMFAGWKRAIERSFNWVS